MKARAAVLTQFGKPMEHREFQLVDPCPGEIVVKMDMAGVCGSDPHIWRGHHPMSWGALPLILGHENVGRVYATRRTGKGAPKEGDRIMWQRSITCGGCHYCLVARKPWLCQERTVYGINYSSSVSPHLRGGYSEFVYLNPKTPVIALPDSADPQRFVAAGCSADTALHAVQVAGLGLAEDVVVLGCGSVGLCTIAYASAASARSIVAIDLNEGRLDMALSFGATATFNASRTTPEERQEHVYARTDGLGASVVFECSGSTSAAAEGFKLARKGARYVMPGFGHDGGTDFTVSGWYDITSKEIELRGCFAGDFRHLVEAIDFIDRSDWPFECLVTHRYTLDMANEALACVDQRRAIKAAIVY